MKTATQLGCMISSLLILLLVPLDLIRVDWLSGESHELSAAIQQAGQESQVTVPARPPNALYKGEQIPQPPEIKFAPGTRTVTIELQVQDPNGYFLPNIRRENFAVFEDGVRQKVDTVQVEHAPVSVALLLEFGGRYHELNKTLGLEVEQIARELLSVVSRGDKVAVFKYDSKLQTVSDFSQDTGSLETAFDHLGTPNISEANFYDALIGALNHTREVTGRKAVIAVSSGIDNSSQATLSAGAGGRQGFGGANLLDRSLACDGERGGRIWTHGSFCSHRLECRGKTAGSFSENFRRPCLCSGFRPGNPRNLR